MTTQYLDPRIWGPHYWFFLHTVAMTYPHHPNSVTKKKYYEFIQSFPLFVPVEEISKKCETLIQEYPVTPYLDNRDSLIRWTHFIHNKVNEALEKKCISLNDFFIEYYNQYKKQDELQQYYQYVKQKAIYFGILIVLCWGIYVLY